MGSTASMEALVWLGPRTMEMQTTAIPHLQAGEVLVEVAAAGICGSELSGYLGQNSLRKPPLIMGHEAAGRIVGISAEARLRDGSSAKEGDRVAFNPLISCLQCDRCLAGFPNLCRQRQLIGVHRPGAFASFVAVPAALCYPVPAMLSTSLAALSEPLACSVRAVALAQLQPEHSLLIIGAGPIGLFCLVAARALGVKRVMVCDMSASRLSIAQRWGAQEVVNVRERDVLTTVQQLIPGGVEAVIDAVGADATRAQAVQAVVPGGNVVFIGLHDEASPLAANYLIRQEITLRGSFAYTPADFDLAFELLTQGALQEEGDWLEERSLAEGAKAFAQLVAGEVTATKIILHVN
ncbi:galactitol-1-phosphate 5-dehydrogenase [Ktedonosporobacter rubrisoli]|uniref:Galactitol-1-phosphate 5-dehydrogenase n=1 Tax=Ktedonosporobacter rubrisoli TaxID=2509675 RepID=A0A4P6K4U8_KTERU|nr:alcohol dehydrogenase catalytic domain-containing protein [Ktedonosporobacter rubrisoli]QBD83279.1 galactitol-1-phosphate 5-dehydrogenase [Ktedonosporobacter rubrisoli]